METWFVSDDELTALALAADPDFEVAHDAVSVWDVIGPEGAERGGSLPEWYMPAPMPGARPRRRGWHRSLALFVVLSFLLIEALGLCVTYGQLVAA